MDEVAALIEPEIPALRRYARALMRDPEAADDLVQDCLERSLSRWHLRRSDRNLRAWLFAILHNLFIDRVRRRRREPLLTGLDDAGSVPDRSVDQDGRAAVVDVVAALNVLSVEQREVVILVCVEDLSYEEAARVTGVPIGTVMSRLSRGRERLRAALEPGPVAQLRRIK